MSVYRHKRSPFWQYDFERGGYRFCGPTDVPIERAKAEAQAFEENEQRAAERLVAKIGESGRQPLDFGAAAERWWAEHGKYLRGQDIEAALRWLTAQIGPRTPLHAITDDTVAKAVAARRKGVRPAGRDAKGVQLWRPISPRTVNQTVTFLLRRVLRRARDNWNAVIIREPKWNKHRLAEPKRMIVELTADREAAIEAVEREGYADHRRFSLITGLRRREGLLTWSQVDFDNACVRLIGKGNRIRVIPLTREAYEILWRQRGHHPEWVFTFVAKRTRTEPKSGRRYVRGQRYPITYWGLGSQKDRTWAKAGIEGRWHDLRHTAGRRLTRANGNLKITQALLGHSDIKTTADFYEDVLVDELRQAMENTASHVGRSRAKAEADVQTSSEPKANERKKKYE